MAHRKLNLIRGDTGAVIGHTNGAQSTSSNVDANLLRSGIERVVDQLSHHRNRSLNHLAGGDALHHGRRKHLDVASMRSNGLWGGSGGRKHGDSTSDVQNSATVRAGHDGIAPRV